MYKIHQFKFNIFQENTAVLSGRKDGECIVVDPGFYTEDEENAFFAHLEHEGLEAAAILVTHGHSDHIFGIAAIQRRFGCPVYINKDDYPVIENCNGLTVKLGLKLPDTSFDRTVICDGDTIRAAGFEFSVIGTPGHSPGSVCYYESTDNFMMTGDTLFAGTIGRTDFDFGDYDKEIVSIMEKLMQMDAGIVIYPGHGAYSTIGYERMNNPFLEPFNEKEEEGVG